MVFCWIALLLHSVKLPTDSTSGLHLLGISDFLVIYWTMLPKTDGNVQAENAKSIKAISSRVTHSIRFFIPPNNLALLLRQLLKPSRCKS
jgi:hypothetical protein